MIRTVTLADSDALTAIYNHYVEESTATFDLLPVSSSEIDRLIHEATPHFPFLVYDTGEGIAGYCYAHSWKSKAAYSHTWEITIYLAPEHTGKGIGGALMKQLIDDCRKKGCKVLIADITAENEGSRRFHERFGFTQVSHFRQVGRKFGRWLDVIDYQLNLG